MKLINQRKKEKVSKYQSLEKQNKQTKARLGFQRVWFDPSPFHLIKKEY